MNREIPEKLSAILGKDRVLTGEETLKEYASDWIGYRRWERFNGDYLTPKPLCVVMAESAQEISDLLVGLNGYDVNVVPVSGRSCVTGGIETTENAVMLDISRMNGIIRFDSENLLVSVLGGTPLEYLEGYCSLRGYTTGHFPQSLPLAQMAGLVATRSTGQLSTLYGGIEDMLIGLEAVMPTGEIIRIKNVPRRAAGIDLRHLFMGSEGRFGVITEVTVKLFKTPAEKWQCAYGFESMDTGLEALREVIQEGWKPSVARLHDAYEAEESYSRFMKEDENLLFFVAHGPKGMAQLTGNAIDAICKKYGAREIGEKLVDVWFETRNNVCYALDRNVKVGNIGETVEISANWSDIGDIYKAACERGAQEIEDVIQFSAHSSHSYPQGTNMYFVVKYKAGADYESVNKNFCHLYEVIMEETLRRGGSIAHHHGVGKYRARWMPEEHGSSYPIFGKLIDALDPHHIMNRGTMLPE